MDNRPTPKIYTRTGDAGETGLFDGTRVSKADPRVEAYGDVDELASLVGVVGAHLDGSELADMVQRLQRDLFALGSQLADPRHRIAARASWAVRYARPSTSSRFSVLMKLSALALSYGEPVRLMLAWIPWAARTAVYSAQAYCTPRSE